MMHPDIHIVITASIETVTAICLTVAFIATCWFSAKAVDFLKARTK